MLVGFDVREQRVDGLFPLEECYYGLWTGILARSDDLRLKRLNDGI